MALVLNIALYAGAILHLINGIRAANPGAIVFAVFALLASIFMSLGFFIVNPNSAALLVLFGKYKGTVKENGFFWVNPLMSPALTSMSISLRVRNHESAKLKVNDKVGNPIEIAVIVVWKVMETFRARFEVENYLEYVKIQSEAALRHMASNYAYDGADSEVTLRGSTDEVSLRLKAELEQRLERAGVDVIEARLSHLAYAPEIAGEMLRKQQASAVVAARAKIVEGAVGMVEHALTELGKTDLVKLDEERKAAMVSNLLVVLCSDHAATPVVNAGTLYQ
jgi:regulator of protease activity HflC (stomatin/prohibitin superfamily)